MKKLLSTLLLLTLGGIACSANPPSLEVVDVHTPKKFPASKTIAMGIDTPMGTTKITAADLQRCHIFYVDQSTPSPFAPGVFEQLLITPGKLVIFDNCVAAVASLRVAPWGQAAEDPKAKVKPVDQGKGEGAQCDIIRINSAVIPSDSPAAGACHALLRAEAARIYQTLRTRK